MRKIIILICATLCAVTLFAQENTLEEQLIEASCEGDLLAVQTLLSDPDIDVNATYDGKTALTEACSEGHLDVVQKLLDHPKIDINKQNTEGYTGLMYAAEKGYKPIADELLLRNADVTIGQTTRSNNYPGRKDRVNTAALLAYKNKHIEIFVSILRVEVRINLLDSVIFEYRQSQYYNSVDEFGNTLLMLAAREGDIDIVRILLELNKKQTIIDRMINPIVHINKKNDDGNTALMLASKHGQLEVVNELLKEKNIKLDITNIFNQTAYDLAATQEIKDAIAANYKNPSKRTSEILGNKISNGFENFQFQWKKDKKK